MISTIIAWCRGEINKDSILKNMDTETAEVLFRPVKRQKFIRKRTDKSSDLQTSSQPFDQQDANQTSDRSSLVGDLEDISEDGIPRVVQLRKPNRLRRGGIEFSTNSKQNLDNKLHPGLAAEDTETDVIRAKFDRFTAHTGQKVDVDKHMYGLLLFSSHIPR